MIEHRVSGRRKVIIIPEGKLKSGWRVFELELRKLLEPSKQALVVSGHGNTLVQHPKRHSVVQLDRSFNEVVRGEKEQENVVHARQALANGKGKQKAETEKMVLPSDLKIQCQSQTNKTASEVTPG